LARNFVGIILALQEFIAESGIESPCNGSMAAFGGRLFCRGLNRNDAVERSGRQ
jgi:hypothetical protein